MMVARGLLARARPALYALAVVTATSVVSSAALLYRAGITIGTAVVAAIGPSLVIGAVAAASRSLCRAMPLRSPGLVRAVFAQGGSAVVASGLWIAAWNAWAGVMARPEVVPGPYLLFALGVALYLGTALMHYLLLEVDASREAEAAALRYQLLAREAELRAFKAQVDPHFLFNSLNAVASLCGTKPAEAREMTQRLAEFYRLMLRMGAMERITLREELDLVGRYLSIEKIRFGQRLDVRMQVAGAAEECMVPPLLLQPLVENAIRHGIASVVEGGIVDIQASLNDGMLRIRIDNPADPDRVPTGGEGIGLQNARGRLRAVSGGRALLRAEESAGRFHVEIELPR